MALQHVDNISQVSKVLRNVIQKILPENLLKEQILLKNEKKKFRILFY